MKNKYLLYISLCLLFSVHKLAAQSENTIAETQQTEETAKKAKKAWEFGIGGDVMQINRAYITNFVKHDAGYDFNLKMRHALYGGDIYLARELNKHLYIDLFGGLGTTTVYDMGNKSENKMYYTAGLGLQWRLSPLFNSKYIDPYFRVGATYLHKDFFVDYTGAAGSGVDEMTYVMKNINNKDGADARNLAAISVGVGINMWFNNSVGVGLQANYLYMPAFIEKQKNVADALHGSVRLLFRFGVENKKTINTRIETVYIERAPDTVVVEKIVKVEKIVEKPQLLCQLLNNVHFEFDKSDITPESSAVLDEVANILKQQINKHFLITGFTDSRGSAEYNMRLSQRRAAAVVKALEERGVPANMIKSRGVGKKISYAPTSVNHNIRLGDRKVTIEELTTLEYWNYIQKRDY